MTGCSEGPGGAPADRTCRHCGAVLPRRAHPYRRYCSARCQTAAYNERRRTQRRRPPATATCPQCRKAFAPSKRQQIYCSARCRNRASYRRRQRRKATPPAVEATCAHCGCSFRYVRKGRERRFCTEACAKKAYKQSQAALAAQRSSEPASSPGRQRPPPEWPRRGTLHRPLRGATSAGAITCHLCGRPLGPGEDFGPWRIRAVHESPRYDWTLRAICPAHYGEDTSDAPTRRESPAR